MTERFRLATRQSALALWQSEHVAARLRAAHPGIGVTLVPLTTSGDRRQDSLSTAGGKGLFVKELEEALRDGRADLAVHSMKDVPARQPDGLVLAAFLPGEDSRDAFVSQKYRSLRALPVGAHVGTASLRREAQLRAERPDLKVGLLRGNVGTRLAKLDAGDFDAILLACAGLRRLGLAGRVTEALDVERFVPAIGQGIVGIECRADDAATRARVATLDDVGSATRLSAERALNAALGGSCTVPVAGHAVLAGGRVRLTGLVASPDGTQVVREQAEGAAADAAALGHALAQRLLDGGGRKILHGLGVSI
ncbi:MAG TPA: hydroxymethylbilane synthase [Verrucomicrobiae bacterium]|nr:hydroxymethylbilane synthase [Verrucomicrobiae bacterium]